MYKKVLLVILLFSSFHPVHAGEDTFIYSLGVKSTSHIEVFINDIPVAKLNPNENEYNRPVNQYLIDGSNKISLVLTPSTDELTNPDSIKKDFHTEITLMQYPKGVFPGDPSGKRLLSEQWLLEKNKAISVPEKKVFSINLNIDHAKWKWQKSEKLTLNTQLLEEVHNFLSTLRGIINTGNVDEYLAQYKIRIQEQAIAYGLEAETLKNRSKNILLERKNETSMQLVPLNKNKYAFRLVANGRLIDCIAKDGEPVLRAKAGSNGLVPVYYDVKLGRIDGKLTILR